MKNIFRRIYFRIPLPIKLKNKIYFYYKSKKECNQFKEVASTLRPSQYAEEYVSTILKIPNHGNGKEYVHYEKHEMLNSSINFVAYYLTQFHPNEKNDEWWGKGSTEWTNVSKAIPQYPNHYQPRLPGELGYYDLRVKDNFRRQIELAHNYGISAFCFYYYWFDGERLLEKPLNMFLEDKDLNIQFCISWANENWTKRFSGTNTDILMKIGESEESNINFIYDVLNLLSDTRYMCINEKPVLIIYRPSNIVNCRNVIKEWRSIAKSQINKELYIIATQEKGDSTDWSKQGFDAETEFQPKSVQTNINEMTKKYHTIQKEFNGCIYDYGDTVNNKRYIKRTNQKKCFYPAVMPMWDNTARRNCNAVIYDGSTPELYGKWLDDAIKIVEENPNTRDAIVFLNAWNEWGEGAYLEPDRYWGYAYLQETYDAIVRRGKDDKKTHR